VQNMPGDVMRGRDAQLEAAVEMLLERVSGEPAGLPEVPAYPVKRKVRD